MALSGIVRLLGNWANLNLHIHGDYVVQQNVRTRCSISHSFINRLSQYEFDGCGKASKDKQLIESFKDRKAMDEAALLIGEQKYDEARGKLRGVSDTGIHNLLQIIECDVILDDVENLNEDVRKFQFELQATQMTYDEIRNVAKAYWEEACYVGAAYLFYSAKETAVSEEPRETIFRIAKLVRDLRPTIEEVFLSELGTKRQSFRHILPLLKELLSAIHALPHLLTDTATITSVAQCIYDIAQCYGSTGQREAFLDLNLEACAYIRTHFGDDAGELKLLGRCLNNAGVAYDMLGEDEKALAKFDEAMVVFHNATDWINKREKKMDDNTTQRNRSQIELKISLKTRKEDHQNKPDTG